MRCSTVADLPARASSEPHCPRLWVSKAGRQEVGAEPPVSTFVRPGGSISGSGQPGSTVSESELKISVLAGSDGVQIESGVRHDAEGVLAGRGEGRLKEAVPARRG